MNMEKIYRKIAQDHGVTVEEVKREMQSAIDDAYKKTGKSAQERVAQACIPHSGSAPTTEELITYVIRHIK